MIMQFLNKKMFVIITLLSLNLGGGSIFAYTWGFTNNTKDALVLEMKLTGWHEGFYNIVKPGEKVEFSWTTPSIRAGYCLSEMRWAKYNLDLKKEGVSQNGGLDLPNYKGRAMGWLTYPYNNGVSGMVDKDIGYLPYQYSTLEFVRESSSKKGVFHEQTKGIQCYSMHFVIEGLGETIKVSSGREIKGPYALMPPGD